jgi:hypothetical protein
MCLPKSTATTRVFGWTAPAALLELAELKDLLTLLAGRPGEGGGRESYAAGPLLGSRWRGLSCLDFGRKRPPFISGDGE